MTLLVMSRLRLGRRAIEVIGTVLGIVLLLTAVALVFRPGCWHGTPGEADSTPGQRRR